MLWYDLCCPYYKVLAKFSIIEARPSLFPSHLRLSFSHQNTPPPTGFPVVRSASVHLSSHISFSLFSLYKTHQSFNMSLGTASRVWLQSGSFKYVSGIVDSVTNTEVIVTTEEGVSISVPKGSAKLSQRTPAAMETTEDLSSLPDLNEPNMLHSLKCRYLQVNRKTALFTCTALCVALTMRMVPYAGRHIHQNRADLGSAESVAEARSPL